MYLVIQTGKPIVLNSKKFLYLMPLDKNDYVYNSWNKRWYKCKEKPANKTEAVFSYVEKKNVPLKYWILGDVVNQCNEAYYPL